MKKILLIIALFSITYDFVFSQTVKRISIENDGVAIPPFDFDTLIPPNNTVPMGNLIYNRSKKSFQFSDGTNWRNMSGRNSLPASSVNNTLINNGYGWIGFRYFKNNGRKIWFENEVILLDTSAVFSIGAKINSSADAGVAVWGISKNGSAVTGTSQSWEGVIAISETDNGAWAFATQIAARASSNNNFGLIAISRSTYSGKFEGRLVMQSGYPYAGIDFENSSEVIRGYWGMRDDNEMGIFGYGLSNWIQRWSINSGTICVATQPTVCSDIRLKKDFQTLSNSFDLINKLQGYNYYLKNGKNTNLQTGFIAQEIQKIFPELVQKDEKCYLSVNYTALIPHLVEAEKSLKYANEQIEKENQLLEIRLLRMEQLVNKLNLKQ